MPDAQEPASEETHDDPIMIAENGVVMHRVGWALIEDGKVKDFRRTYSTATHPFEDVPEDAYIGQHDQSRLTVPMKGIAVIPATPGLCAPGMLVDTKGNFTPTEGRAEHLHPSEPAYLAGPAPMVGDTAARREDDDVLKASQDRTEKLAKAEEAMKEAHEKEPHDPAEHRMLEQAVDTHSAEDVKQEKEGGEKPSASGESPPKSE